VHDSSPQASAHANTAHPQDPLAGRDGGTGGRREQLRHVRLLPRFPSGDQLGVIEDLRLACTPLLPRRIGHAVNPAQPAPAADLPSTVRPSIAVMSFGILLVTVLALTH
jgi:hypothetical protein